MKIKKYFISIFLMICLVFPTLALVSCGDKKTVAAPEIESIYQDSNGTVCVKHKGLTNSYNPEFSLDGTNWYSSQFIDSKTVSILTYNSNNKFQYTNNSSEFVEISETTISIRLRESETQDSKASDASNEFSYTLKTPQTMSNIDTTNQILLNTSSQVFNQPLTTASNSIYIVYNNTESKFTFAKQTVENQTLVSGENYNYDFCYRQNTLLASTLEYCYIKQSDYPNTQARSQQIEEDAISGKLQFENCSTNFTLNTDNLADSACGNGQKVALVVFRLKQTTTKLASHTQLVEIVPESTNYSATLNSGADFTASQTLEGSITKTEIKFDQSKTITLDDLKAASGLVKFSNYDLTNQLIISNSNYSLSLSNGNTSLTSADFGQTYNLIFSVDSKAVFSLSIKVSSSN